MCDKNKCAHFGTCISDPGNTAGHNYKCDCSTSDGYLLDSNGDCTRIKDLCTGHPCRHLDFSAQCKIIRDDPGYNCTCTKGSYTGKTCEDHTASFTDWEWFCVTSTVLSVLPVPHMINRFKRRLKLLEDPRLPEGKDALGPFGLFMCIFGVFDLVLDCLLCSTLSACNQSVLLWCCIVTITVTTAMTWYHGYVTLQHIVLVDTRANSPAKDWLIQNPVTGPLIVLCSSSRLNSMAILRLRIGGKMLIDFPDSAGHRYFYFLKNSGMYHFVSSQAVCRSL